MASPRPRLHTAPMPTRPLPSFDSAWRRAQRYQPFFCEENVWQLLRAGALPADAAAVFVSNDDRSVAMWGQRATDEDPIVWDYHVVALLPGADLVVDLDDRQRCAWPRADWLAHAFREPLEARFRARFRIVPTLEFLATFSSDRSHMRDLHGNPLQSFPNWPAPFDPQLGHTLPRFVDLAEAIAGVVTDAAGLLRYAR